METNWYTWFGGRKQFNALLGTLLISAAAYVLDASFDAYALWLSVFLLGNATANVIQKRVTQ